MYKTETDCAFIGICDDAKRRILFTEKDFLSIKASVVLSFRPSVRGRLERRGEGRSKNCHFLVLSHLIPPAPSRSGLSPSVDETQEETPGRGDPREKRLYRVLILWLFLHFLNFKWEYWNTDIDMKRFIVTIYHYYHRPYCYWSLRESWFLPLVAKVALLCSQLISLTVKWR